MVSTLKCQAGKVVIFFPAGLNNDRRSGYMVGWFPLEQESRGSEHGSLYYHNALID